MTPKELPIGMCNKIKGYECPLIEQLQSKIKELEKWLPLLYRHLETKTSLDRDVKEALKDFILNQKTGDKE